MPITAVLFDLDETLVVEKEAVEAAFLATCEIARHRSGIDPAALAEAVRVRARELWQEAPAREYCLSVGVSSWEGLWASFLGDRPELAALREWAPTYRRATWTMALADHAVDDQSLADQLAATYPDEQRARRTAFPDAQPVLTQLRQRYRLALVTNGVPDVQRDKLRGAGLREFFDAVIISGEIGVGKPDSAIFEAALLALGTAPGQAVMVGDSPKRDVQGAHSAGVRGIWLNRRGKNRDDEVQPDAEIATLKELPPLLDEMSAS